MRWGSCAWICAAALHSVTRVNASLSSVAAQTPPHATVQGTIVRGVVQESVPDAVLHHTSTQLPDGIVLDDGADIDLITWSAQHAKLSDSAQRSDHTQPHQPCDDCFLVVGVKTRVVDGFQSRQLIRATWANPQYTQQLNTRVVFLACEPDSQRYEDINATRNALALEKQVYGDLLTHELGGCVDSYFRLVDKVVGFYHWVSLSHPATSYVMTADDDVYVRLDRVVDMLRDEATPRMRYYAGQVPSIATGRLVPAERSPYSKYYLPRDVYPMSEHSPRAIGPHYLLSSDLVLFLVRNRHQLHGAGTIEDLSVGFWLLALLQVHPVHVPVFDSILSNLCRHSLVSYGDLSRHAMRQIHTNLKHGNRFCQYFSWGAWINPNAKLPDHRKIQLGNEVTYKWKFQVGSFTRTFEVDITVHFPVISLTLPVVKFTSSMESYDALCGKLDRVAASFRRRLPIMLCDDLLNKLGEFAGQEQAINSALFGLTRSNLPPLSGFSVAVKVWISHGALRWRALVECLVAEIYPDIHIYVLDQTTSPTATTRVKPDFVVVASEELGDPSVVSTNSRFLVFVSTAGTQWAHEDVFGDDMIRFTGVKPQIITETGSSLTPHLYVPLVSMVFSDSLVHSPMALLQPSSKRKPDFSPIERFAVLHCNSRTHSLLTELQDTTASHSCTADKSSSIETNNDTDHDTMSESTSETIFAFDADVARYTQAKFTMAIETQQSTPGYIGETIAAAFLAGSVPVYDGDDATVSQLFNPKAFINCSRFASLRDCAEYIKQVDRSHVLCEAMRSEPPVVNETAFYEVFSWHPDVLQRLRRETQSDFQKVDMIERLRDMINSL